MVRWQLAARGVADERVLRAMHDVPREAFVPEAMVEFAYDDSALPIAEEQTISQPFIVALMLEALALEPSARLLDVGTGSGYAAAVASRLVAEVYTIERHRALAEAAESTFRELGYDNIHVRVGDGSRGWPEAAPFDGIQVAAAGPSVPRELLEQLAPYGRLVLPTGVARLQRLLRVTRTESGFVEDDLGDVRFVPLISEEAVPGAQTSTGKRRWRTARRNAPRTPTPVRPAAPRPSASESTSGTPTGVHGRAALPAPRRALHTQVRAGAEAFGSIDEADLGALLTRIGDSELVLLGEATHGTSEFYRMRARITRELIERRGFRAITLEADWPDVARLDAWVRHHEPVQPDLAPFTRFPTWMWRNDEFRGLVVWLHGFNAERPEDDRVALYGLDLYSLYTSLDAVLRYLDDVDAETAHAARARYGCLTPWARDPASYGRAAITGRYRECEHDVVATLGDLLEKRIQLEPLGERRYFEAEQNARLVANAERYYRAMYYGSRTSWNLRDQHMFDTLLAVREP
jgi:protein-L-isoaspartate(D-aspartate) O-methyltransferase